MKGWTATETKDSYIVHACPEFVRCGYGCGRYRSADDYILALEIAIQKRKEQLAIMKKYPDSFRKQNEKLKIKNKKLQDKLDAEQWWITCHMGE